MVRYIITVCLLLIALIDVTYSSEYKFIGDIHYIYWNEEPYYIIKHDSIYGDHEFDDYPKSFCVKENIYLLDDISNRILVINTNGIQNEISLQNIIIGDHYAYGAKDNYFCIDTFLSVNTNLTVELFLAFYMSDKHEYVYIEYTNNTDYQIKEEINEFSNEILLCPNIEYEFHYMYEKMVDEYNIIESNQINCFDLNYNYLFSLRLPNTKEWYYQPFSYMQRTDLYNNIYALQRDDDGMYFLKWEKIDYLPTATNHTPPDAILTTTGGDYAYFSPSDFELNLSGRSRTLKGVTIDEPLTAGFDGNETFYLLSSNRIETFNKRGKLQDAYDLSYPPEDWMITAEGLFIKYTDTNQGLVKYARYDSEGMTEIYADGFNYYGYSVEIGRYENIYDEINVPAIILKSDGEEIRTFKYGEDDDILEAEIAGVDGEGYVWVRVVYTSASSATRSTGSATRSTSSASGSASETYGELIKFEPEGDFANRVYMDGETGLDAYSQVAVCSLSGAERSSLSGAEGSDESTVYILSDDQLITFEKEEVVVPGLDESKSAVAEYLSEKDYTADTEEYDEYDYAVPWYLDVDLLKLEINPYQLLINEIYARNGYQFKSELWSDIFSEVDWFSKESPIELNKFEQANVDAISELRDSMD